MKHISPIYFMTIYFINICLQSAFLVNLGYILNTKNKSLVLTSVETFLIYVSIESILELIGNLSLFTIWDNLYTDRWLVGPLLMNIILFILSLLIFKYVSKFDKKTKIG